jgi:hypothetical protein
MSDKNDKPVVNFAILQNVEDYVEKSGKFRTKCAFFNIPGRDSGSANAVYIPYCDKQRFNFGQLLDDYRGHGVFRPPETGKRWQITDFILFREHFHDIHCPRPCSGYRNKTVAALFDKVWSRIFGAKLHQMPADNPSTPQSVLKQAINAVPAVKYALGVGGIISVIAIVRGFGIDFRVALWGAVVMLVLMTVLLIFAKASSRPQSAFKGPAFIHTWFSLLLFMATATALFLSVFFGKPLDLRTLVAPVHAEQTKASAPKVQSLHELFVTDCGKTHILGSYTLQGNTANGQRASYGIEYIVCGDFETKTLYVSFFLPRSDATLLACRYLPNAYDQILAGNLTSLLPGITHKLPGERSETWAELKPSGRVYVYHETPLLDSELAELTTQYEQRGLSPQFRSKDYEILRNSPLYDGKS